MGKIIQNIPGDIINFSLKLSKWICVWVFFSVLIFRTEELAMAYLAAALHEGAHFLVCILLKVRPVGIKFGIAGVELKTEYVESTTGKIIISAAGPAASFMLFLYMYAFGLMFDITNYAYSFFTLANLSIGIINLFPISPLDGGAIAGALFVKFCGIINGNKAYRIFSSVFLGIFAVVNLLLGFMGIFNPWLFVILIFTAGGVRREKLWGIKEKRRVLSGEIKPAPKLRLMACDCESELLSLASYIGGDYTLLVAAFCGERFFGEINQFEITEGIRKYGALCTVKEYIQKQQKSAL